MGYIMLFLIGFGLAVSGGITIISYMNFLPAGVTWGEYFTFIQTRIECYFLPIGFILMLLVINRIPQLQKKEE